MCAPSCTVCAPGRACTRSGRSLCARARPACARALTCTCPSGALILPPPEGIPARAPDLRRQQVRRTFARLVGAVYVTELTLNRCLQERLETALVNLRPKGAPVPVPARLACQARALASRDRPLLGCLRS